MNSSSSPSLTLGKEECSMVTGLDWDSCCPCCPPVWDGFLCWPPSTLNTVVEQPCPANIPQLNTANFAFRNCSGGGWLQEDGMVDRGEALNSSRPLGFTHFQPCFDEDVIDVVKGFFNSTDADMEWKLFILNFTRMMEIVGYSISFISIALSIFILSHFRHHFTLVCRVLRTQEKRIHFHLYLSMLIQVTVRLIIYFDQQIMKEWTTDNSNTTSSTVEMGSSLVCIAEVPQNLSNTSRAREDEIILESRIAEAEEYKGIGNMVAVCQLAWVLLEYTRTAMFHWMFLEGLHLHNILVVNVFLTNTDTNHRVYLLVGWLAPLVSTSAWAIMAFYNMEHLCWFGYNHKLFYWISEGPRLTIILVNFLFLINIIRMLYSKVGSQYSSDTNFTSQIRTSVKAAIVLQPLLGITNIMQIVFNPYDSTVSYFTFWSLTTAFLASFQGFFAALFYCFCNKEVQKVVRHSFLVHMSRRQTETTLPARSESIKTTRVRLSFRRSNTLHKKRPSWCQDMPTSTTGDEVNGEGIGWSPRGRSLDLRGCSTWGLSTVEEGAEAQPLAVLKDKNTRVSDGIVK